MLSHLALYIPTPSSLSNETTPAPRSCLRKHTAHKTMSTVANPASAECHGLPDGISRVQVPFVIDFVFVSGKGNIAQFTSNPDIGRFAETDLPFPMTDVFKSTFFLTGHNLDWAAVRCGDRDPTLHERVHDTRERLGNGFSPQQLDALVGIMNSDLEGDALQKACIDVLAPLVLPLAPGEKLPEDVKNAFVQLLLNPLECLVLPKYVAARKARQYIEDYVATILPDREHPIDYVHNIGAGSVGLKSAITSMRDLQPGQDGVNFISQHPINPGAFRVAARETTVGGMFPADKPLRPGHSVILLKTGDVAKEVGDGSFLLDVGVPQRQCPFKPLFLNAMDHLGKSKK